MALRHHTLIFLFLFYVLGINYCRADLGETMDQMIHRYGNPVPPNTSGADPTKRVAVFSKSPYFIVAFLQNGTVSTETISKLDKSSFSDTEIAEILKNNSLVDQVWTGPILLYQSKRWQRGDGAIASYAFGGRFMNLRLHSSKETKPDSSPDL